MSGADDGVTEPQVEREDPTVVVPETKEPLTLRDIIKAELTDADHVTLAQLNGLLLHVEELRLKVRTAAVGLTSGGRKRLRELYNML